MCDIDGRPSCITERTRTARKQHHCCECDTPISIGERYHYMSGVWEGRGESFKAHVRCNDMRQWMHHEHKARERVVRAAEQAINRSSSSEYGAARTALREADKSCPPCGPCMRGLEAAIAEWLAEGFDVWTMAGSPWANAE